MQRLTVDVDALDMTQAAYRLVDELGHERAGDLADAIVEQLETVEALRGMAEASRNGSTSDHDHDDDGVCDACSRFTAPCDDCSTDTLNMADGAEWYMVHDDIWAQADGAEFLCVGCLGERLGRALTGADLIVCHANYPDVHDTPRLLELKMASGITLDQLVKSQVRHGWAVADTLRHLGKLPMLSSEHPPPPDDQAIAP
jgi:hypothetical protein